MLSKRASSSTATMPVSVRVTWHVRVRFMLSNKWELKPFANVPGIRSLGHELSSKSLHKQKYLLADRVDKHHVRKIDNQLHCVVAARNERTDFLSSLARESAFEPADQNTV